MTFQNPVGHSNQLSYLDIRGELGYLIDVLFGFILKVVYSLIGCSCSKGLEGLKFKSGLQLHFDFEDQGVLVLIYKFNESLLINHFFLVLIIC